MPNKKSCQGAIKMSEKYYVSVEVGDIQDSPFDDHFHYYEIEASKQQLEEIESIL